MTISQADFEAWRAPRLGDANPTRLDNPLWASLVHDRINAYQVNQRFGYERQPDTGPTWCFDRFGQSATTLADGRIVYIAGEHEDGYDPDFFIYNDVVIVAPGGAVAIYGYPREAFPPTDFHSATLVGDAIVIIGNLSYVGNRQPGLTQVCRLALATLAIEPVQTVGEMPGWIHRHAATLADDGTTIVVRGGQIDVGRDRAFVENIDEWALDLASLSWTRRTALDWQHFTLVRADGRMNCLWDLRQALWHADHPDARQGVDYAARLREHTARDPDLELVRTLYQFDGATVEPQREGDDYNLHRVRIDGIDVRFTENSYRIAAMVEGTLDEARLGAVQRALQGTLEQLENAAWRLEPSE